MRRRSTWRPSSPTRRCSRSVDASWPVCAGSGVTVVVIVACSVFLSPRADSYITRANIFSLNPSHRLFYSLPLLINDSGSRWQRSATALRAHTKAMPQNAPPRTPRVAQETGSSRVECGQRHVWAVSWALQTSDGKGHRRVPRQGKGTHSHQSEGKQPPLRTAGTEQIRLSSQEGEKHHTALCGNRWWTCPSCVYEDKEIRRRFDAISVRAGLKRTLPVVEQ